MNMAMLTSDIYSISSLVGMSWPLHDGVQDQTPSPIAAIACAPLRAHHSRLLEAQSCTDRGVLRVCRILWARDRKRYWQQISEMASPDERVPEVLAPHPRSSWKAASWFRKVSSSVLGGGAMVL